MTDGKNRTLVGIVVVCVLAVGLLGGLYGNAYNELSATRSDLQDLKQTFSVVNTSLSKARIDAALAENFSANYFSAWSQFYQSKDIEDKGWFNYNKADGYYDEGNWFNAVGYFSEAAVYFRAAR
ncbi:MAG: hypothetical protein KKC68_07515, partial [Candidatus Thermoplasmatota archaeon]|nr:hypothetical protein [Candidatus Thermoplasmatota archaeon]